MSRFLQTALTLIWGLWFGGLIMLFVAVGSLFKTFASDYETAGAAASVIFQQFGKIRLIIAALSVVFTFWWWMLARTRMKFALFGLFGAAIVSGLCGATIVTPHLEQLRTARLTHTPEFRRLHGLSMQFYVAETLFITAAGVVLAQVRKPVEV